MPGLAARTVEKNRQLGLTVLKQGAVHLQTESVVVYILHSFHFPSGPLACRKVKSAAAQNIASKPSIQVVYFFVTVLATRLGPSPQSSTPCQQTFPCCTAHLV